MLCLAHFSGVMCISAAFFATGASFFEKRAELRAEQIRFWLLVLS